MHQSLEARSPFLDHVREFAAALPFGLRLAAGVESVCTEIAGGVRRTGAGGASAASACR